ncbi:chemotaxis response regulator protein-glutamate methylesterase [Halobacillus fulvus]|nr:chemotaxis response regulator protein-glutamate methylesterase [Halobacillus fulvus]
MIKIRVLIVDDSAFMRKILTDILQKDQRIEVVGTARNGEDGVKQVRKLRPDVVTLDVEMPVMNGLEALDQMLGVHPVPVIMVSSLTKEGAESTIQAMASGAIDFITKPSGSISLDMEKVEKEMIRKVIQASKAKVRRSSPSTVLPDQIPPKLRASSLQPIIAIGTSTGGPRALDQVIPKLPKKLPAPVVIVQHMPPGFTKSLADRLNRKSAVEVKEAEHGEELLNGTVYIAPGGQHMTVVEQKRRYFISLDVTEPLQGHRPSVNRLFSSLVDIQAIKPITVIMTGMGADGTEGVMVLKKKLHMHSIAEAEETCVVYGMPKAVIQSGLADEVVPVTEISHRLLQALAK